MLTRKQLELLLFIDKTLRRSGISPSFDEMKQALGLRSKSGIHRLMLGLEERGFIRRLPHRARALEVLRLPQGRDGDSGSNVISDRRLTAARDRRGTRESMAPPLPDDHDADADSAHAMLPFYGKIAAGTPIAALADHTRFIDVPVDMIGAGEHYALEIEGDSMVEAGILNGDVVILQKTANAENGAIVVAFVDNEEATLKRIRRRGQSIALEPANASYETRICGPDQVKVQGKLVGLLRRYG
jgi:repressor LexA